MTSLVQVHNCADFWQQTYSNVKNIVDIKVCGDWTVFDIVKVVAVTTSIFVGLHYTFGSSLLRGYEIAQWYRSVYEPWDALVLSTAAITSICSLVYFIFQQWAPVEINVADAKRLGVPEYVRDYRGILLSQPVDFWGRKDKSLILEILNEKIENDPSALSSVDTLIQEELKKYWRAKMGIPDHFQGLTTQQLMAFRHYVLTTRKDIPWQKEVKEQISRALIRSVEQNPSDLQQIDPTLEESLTELFVSDRGRDLDSRSLPELKGLIQGRARFPWEEALREAALQAIARKIEPRDIPEMDEELRQKLVPLLSQPVCQRNLSFILHMLQKKPAGAQNVLEYQHCQERLNAYALEIANQLYSNAGNDEKLLAAALKQCLELKRQAGEALDDRFLKAMLAIEKDLYAKFDRQHPPASATQEILIEFLIYKKKVDPSIRIPLGHIQKIPLSQDPKLQTAIGLVIADHLFRLLEIDALPEGKVDPNFVQQIPRLEEVLQEIISKSTVSLSELAPYFVAALKITEIKHDGKFVRTNTEEHKIGWEQWIKHQDGRIRAVFHLFMYVIVASGPDQTAIPRYRTLLMDVATAMIQANRAQARWVYLPGDLSLLFAELNTMPPPAPVSKSDTGLAFQKCIEAYDQRKLLHPHYLPSPFPRRPSQGGGMLTGLFGADAPEPAAEQPAVTTGSDTIRARSLFLT